MGLEAENHRPGDDARCIGWHGSRVAHGKNGLRTEISGPTEAERRSKSSPRGARGQETARPQLVAKGCCCECSALRPEFVRLAYWHRKAATGPLVWYVGSRKKLCCPDAATGVYRPSSTGRSR